MFGLLNARNDLNPNYVTFIDSYLSTLHTAIGCTDEDGEPFNNLAGVWSLSDETQAQGIANCLHFLESGAGLLLLDVISPDWYDWDLAGVDFFYTRQDIETSGYMTRSLGDVGQRLEALAVQYREMFAYIDNGELFFE